MLLKEFDAKIPKIQVHKQEARLYYRLPGDCIDGAPVLADAYGEAMPQYDAEGALCNLTWRRVTYSNLRSLLQSI